MNWFVQLLFWVCVLGVITPYTLYPLLLFLLSRLRRTPASEDVLFPVTFVISAYNEAEVIEQKLQNTRELEYPKDQLQIIVISDASDDGTDQIVDRYEDVLLCRQTQRRGKSAAITTFAHRFRGDVVVFSDANSIYQPNALRLLVGHFGRPEVGYAVGQQKYTQGTGQSGESESAYWDFEVRIKTWEGRLGSVVGGDGAIMAIRRDLVTPLRADDINDFVLPLKIVAAGYRGVFEPNAICFEEAAPSFGGEFRRKVRIVNRSFRAVLRTPQALNPLKVGIFAWQLACHKVIRWFAGFFMLGALILNIGLVLAGSPFYQWLLGIQLAFYGAALAKHLPRIGGWKPFVLCYYFCLSNLAAAIGIVNVGLGRKFVTWTPQRGSAEIELPRTP